MIENNSLYFPKSCYIHIPFCNKKCAYCSFTTYEKVEGKDQYIKYLIKEIDLYKKDILETVYLGGGTPSVIDPMLIHDVLMKLNTNKNAEITIEFNPEKNYYKNLKSYKEIGINRLSIGCQTFDDNLLKKLGRTHDSYEAKKAFYIARDEGFKNINIDIMFSLPNQTMEDLKKDLNIIKDLAPEHISIYSLIWKEGTKFSLLKQKGILSQVSEDLEADMYEYIIDFFNKNDYIHYEISSFCKKGFESKHNIAYWRNETYYGFGLGASGYIKNIRYTNATNFKKYYESLDKNILPFHEKEIITNKKILEYSLILGLRMLKEGINIRKLEKEFEIESFYTKSLKKLSEQNFLYLEDDSYKLTNKGLFFSNEVFAELLDI